MKFLKFSFILAAVLCAVLCLFGCESAQSSTLNATATEVLRADFLEEFELDGTGSSFLESGFGLTEAELKEKFCDGNSYGAQLTLSVGNTNDFAVNILGLDVKDNGRKKIYISTVGDAVVGLPKNYDGSQTVSFYVVADNSIPFDELLAEITDMNPRVVYTDAATGVEELSAAKDSQLKYEALTKQRPTTTEETV